MVIMFMMCGEYKINPNYASLDFPPPLFYYSYVQVYVLY